MASKFFFRLILVAFLSSQLDAHQRSESYSKITIETTEDSYSIEKIFTVQLSVLSKMGWPQYSNWQERLSLHLVGEFSSGTNCNLEAQPRILSSQSTGYFRLFWKEICGGQFKELTNNVFFDEDSSHAHISTLTFDGLIYPEKLFTSQSRLWKVNHQENQQDTPNSSILDYFLLGLEHISSGYDHIAFLLGIILLNRRIKPLLIAVTGFTVGHSVTLLLGAMNIVSPSTGFVESLIGYSIFLIGLEYICRQTKQHFFYSKFFLLAFPLFLIFYTQYSNSTYLIGLVGVGLFTISYLLLINRLKGINLSILVTSLFGLVHGFGFSGSLSEINLPPDRLFQALLGFNLGVEVGQLVIIIGVLGLSLVFLNTKQEHLKTLRLIAASFLVTLGTYWFLGRIF